MAGKQDALACRSIADITATGLQTEALPIYRIAVGRQNVHIEDSPARQVPFERNRERLDRRSRLRGEENSARPEQVRAGGHQREVHPPGPEGRQASLHQRFQPRTILLRARQIRARDHDRAGSRLLGQPAGRDDLRVPRIAGGEKFSP